MTIKDTLRIKNSLTAIDILFGLSYIFNNFTIEAITET